MIVLMVGSRFFIGVLFYQDAGMQKKYSKTDVLEIQVNPNSGGHSRGGGEAHKRIKEVGDLISFVKTQFLASVSLHLQEDLCK